MASLERIGQWLEKRGIVFYEIVDDNVIFMLPSSIDGYHYAIRLDFRQKCFIARLYIVDDKKEPFEIAKHRKKAMRFMLNENDTYLLGRWSYDSDDKTVTFDIVIPAHDAHLDQAVFEHILGVMLDDGCKSADKLIGIVKEGKEPETMDDEIEALIKDLFKQIASTQKEEKIS